MATDTERMILELSANMRTFEKNMIDAAGSADRAAQRIERRFDNMNRTITRDFQRFGQTAAAVIATIGVGAIARDVTQLGDTWTMVGNRLAFAGVEAQNLATVQLHIADIASRTRSELDATADLFSRMYRSSEDLGASLSEVAAVTEIVSKALAGAAQSERQGAIRQLGQGLGAGNLAGDELRSILENSRPIAEAIAAEFETTVGNLRVLGKQGVLESRRVFEAILRAGDDIDASFARTTFTVADAFQKLRTESAKFIGTNAQTSASVRGLTQLIDFVANNFEALAAATVVTATVMGGAFAGVAVARTVVALTNLTVTATTARNALAFFGGPLGIILTLAGGALAYVATQTDLLSSSTQTLARATDSGYTALQRIASLAEDLQAVADAGADAADQTSDLAVASRNASELLDEMGANSAHASERLGILGQTQNALARIERDRTEATIAQAAADADAAVATIKRTAAMRGLIASIDLNPRTLGRVEGALTPDERGEISDLQEQATFYRATLAQLSGITDETWEAIYNRRTDGANRTADAEGRGAASMRQQRADLERSLELTIAQIQGRADAVEWLEREEDVEKRTRAWIEAGNNAIAARAIAESEVLAIAQANEEAAQRQLSLMQLQDGIELARIANNSALAQSLQDEYEVRRRTLDLVQMLHITEEDARERAEQWIAAIQDARAEENAFQLDIRSMEEAAEIARARGDERSETAIRRRLEIEERIADLRRLGLSEEVATQRAEGEVAALERADLQGKFREWFRGGAREAFDGDFGEYFQNWVTERFAAGMDEALNQVADILFDMGEQLWAQISGDLFGGAQQQASQQTDWVGSVTEAAAEAAASLRNVLGGASDDAAAKLLIQSAASASSAVKEELASTQKAAAAQSEVFQMYAVAKAAAAAASALSQVASSGGGSSGGTGGIIGSIISAFTGGSGFGPSSGNGFAIPKFGRAAGGQMNAGVAYTVGENGREIVVPSVPSYAIPNGAIGGGGSPYVDARQFNFYGASDELREELLGILSQDMQNRRATTLAFVDDAFDRREVLNR